MKLYERGEKIKSEKKASTQKGKIYETILKVYSSSYWNVLIISLFYVAIITLMICFYDVMGIYLI
jgi:hypothetical protein